MAKKVASGEWQVARKERGKALARGAQSKNTEFTEKDCQLILREPWEPPAWREAWVRCA